LFLLIDGYELQRLDPPLPIAHHGLLTVEPVARLAAWQGAGLSVPWTLAALSRPRLHWERLLGTETVDGGTITVADTALYLVSRQVLQARSLADGRRLWDVAQPGPAGPWRTVRTRDWLIAYPSQAGPGESFPVVCCDPKDGQVVQRLNFPAEGARAG